MAKKIILTEEQLKRMSLLINEQFDSYIYDLILDKYNDVGMEGMDEDEIAYLKSGGESNVPERFLDGDLDIDTEESESDYSGLETFKEIMDTNNHRIVDTAPDGKLRVVFKEKPELLADLIDVVPESSLELKKGYIIILVPDKWTDDIFGEEI